MRANSHEEAIRLAVDLLNYDKESGIFTWKSDRSKNRLAGSVAGGIDQRGYMKIFIAWKLVAAHRIAWFMEHDEFPEVIDHVDGNRSNNRISNLRKVTYSQNNLNRKMGCNSAAGVPGIYLNVHGAYIVRTLCNGKRRYIGYYRNIEDAIQARVASLKKIHGDFHIRWIEEI